MANIYLYFFIVIISCGKVASTCCLNRMIILTKLFTYFKEALFYFFFNFRLKLFLHIVHLQILSFKMFQWVLLLIIPHLLLIFLNRCLICFIKNAYFTVFLCSRDVIRAKNIIITKHLLLLLLLLLLVIESPSIIIIIHILLLSHVLVQI